MTSFSIHPAVDSGFPEAAADFAGGTRTCRCATDPKLWPNFLHQRRMVS